LRKPTIQLALLRIDYESALLHDLTKALLLPDALFVKSFFTENQISNLGRIEKACDVEVETDVRNADAARPHWLRNCSNAPNVAQFHQLCGFFPPRSDQREFEILKINPNF
jgi:hypothetical protein